MKKSWGKNLLSGALMILALCAVAAVVWSFLIARPPDMRSGQREPSATILFLIFPVRYF